MELRIDSLPTPLSASYSADNTEQETHLEPSLRSSHIASIRPLSGSYTPFELYNFCCVRLAEREQEGESLFKCLDVGSGVES